MQYLFNASLVMMFALPALADPIAMAPQDYSPQQSVYQLGGSIERKVRPSKSLPIAPQPRAALALPLTPANSTRRETAFMGVVIFADQGWDDGRDAYRLGTAYTQGATTAGVAVTYLEAGRQISRSELYLDYALNQNFSVGMAGILDNDYQIESDPVPQLGLSAAYSSQGGAFLEGGISNAESSVPVFGLSIGLRF